MQTATLSELFEMQKVLNDRIIREKGLESQDLLPNTVLALQVELGELANEHRGFKHWSNDRNPRVSGLRGDVPYNPMLEEYVDALSFILCLVSFCDLDDQQYILENVKPKPRKDGNIVLHLIVMIRNAGAIAFAPNEDPVYYIKETFDAHLGLGRMLGFEWEQIAEAYMAKNRVNHERQESGY